jgi:uncharacterized membrane protein YedE/YeeE
MALRKKKSTVESLWPYLGFGVLFGYFLSKSRASDYDTVLDMFLFKDFQLYGVIGMAVAVTALGIFLLRRRKKPTASGEKLDWKSSSFEPNRLIGAFLFGAGWALAGTCPGTSLVQIGEGKLMAFVTVIGILTGVWAYQKIKPRSSSKDPVC